MNPVVLSLALAGLLGVMLAALRLLARGLGMRLPRWVMACGLVLPFLVLAPWLARDRVLATTGALAGQIPGTVVPATPDPHKILNDAVFQFIPWELEVRHALRSGHLPFWSDALDGGSSPWVNPQAGVLSPIANLARLLPIQDFLLATLALKILVAFTGAWLLARALGARRATALLAGIACGVGGGVMGWALFPHTQAVAWIPWVVLGAVRTMRRPVPARLLATALATAALLLSGHPETALGGGLLAGGAAIFFRRRRPPFWPPLGKTAAAAALGFALAAPHLVPFAAIVGTTQRATDTAAHELAGQPVWNDPMSWFFEGRGQFLLAPFHPQAFGPPYTEPFRGPLSWPDATSGYVGLLTIAGALALLLPWPRTGRRRAALARAGRFFLAAAALGFLLAAHPLPLLRLLFLLAPAKKLAYSRLLLPAALALAVAGALGWDRLLRALLKNRPSWLRLAVQALLPLLLLVDLVPWARSLLPRGEPGLFFPPSPLLATVAGEAKADGGPWRVAGEDYLVYPGVLSVYGLEDVRAHNPLTPISQLRALGAAFDFAPTMYRYFAPFQHPDQPFLDFLNVRVVVSNVYLPAPRRFERIDHGEVEPYRLWRNPQALPRWFFAKGADVIQPAELPGWIAALDDPRRVALWSSEVGSWRPAAESAAEADGLEVLAESLASHLVPGRIRLTCAPAPAGPQTGAGERLLATSIPFARGWKATAEGEPLRLVTVNGAYLGVVMPPEVTAVELRFRPAGLGIGFALATLGFLAVGGLLAASRPKAEERPLRM